jgi:hypothetical protein
VQEAAEDLQSLDTSQLSQADQETLAQQLERAAGALSETQPELAGQLQAAAQALRAGSTRRSAGAPGRTLRPWPGLPSSSL